MLRLDPYPACIPLIAERGGHQVKSPTSRPGAKLGIGACLCLLLLACSCRSTPQLMPTPNVYLTRLTNAFSHVPPALQTNVVDLLYVTDRAPEHDRTGRLVYGSGRSQSLAFGHCYVSMGDWASWDNLRTNSLAARRSNRFPLRNLGVLERGRFPETPMRLTSNSTPSAASSEAERAFATARAGLQAEIRRRLDLTSRKEVIVFVHGFNNDFTWANVLTAQLWHFLEREGVPIAYTWPAGHGGLRGYTYDRESGEFTVFHLKQFLRTLFECPGIERIHLLAHSRGTDVLTTALRELAIERRGTQPAPVPFGPVANLVLLAPDLDAQVASQRLAAEHLEMTVGRTTIYVCSEDRAITFANWFFEGVRRIGILRESDFTEEQKAFLRLYRNVNFVDARVRAGFLSHGYFYSNPAVSSDLLLLLREDCPPGSPQCRPLEGDGDPFWRITESYPAR